MESYWGVERHRPLDILKLLLKRCLQLGGTGVFDVDRVDFERSIFEKSISKESRNKSF